MGHRLLAWLSWPLGMALQTSVIVLAGWHDPNSVSRVMVITTTAFLVALVGLEQALPYRREWSIRGDREIWRDIGHAVLYTGLGGNVAKIVFLYGFASALSRSGFEGGFGIWPVNSPLVVQLLIVMLLGDLLEYWYHRLAHTAPWLWPLHTTSHADPPERAQGASASRGLLPGAWPGRLGAALAYWRSARTGCLAVRRGSSVWRSGSRQYRFSYPGLRSPNFRHPGIPSHSSFDRCEIKGTPTIRRCSQFGT